MFLPPMCRQRGTEKRKPWIKINVLSAENEMKAAGFVSEKTNTGFWRVVSMSFNAHTCTHRCHWIT